MKTKLSLINFLMVLFMGFGCDEKQENTQTGLPELIYVSHSACKNNKSANLGEDNSQDCLNYSYETNTKMLTLIHKNAAFNCCPDSIMADFSFVGDTIIITETETSASCNCNCVYDLNFTIENLEKKAWTIKIVEPYIGEGEILKGIIDLPNEMSGEFCVNRPYYPWQ